MEHPVMWFVRIVFALAFATVVLYMTPGCDDAHDCAEWCEDTYNVDGWTDAAMECICDLPCCWECGSGDGACRDICDDDPNCIDY